jgi:hypothetical protein
MFNLYPQKSLRAIIWQRPSSDDRISSMNKIRRIAICSNLSRLKFWIMIQVFCKFHKTRVPQSARLKLLQDTIKPKLKIISKLTMSRKLVNAV